METQPSMDDLFLTRVQQIIESNLDNEHFSVEDLASEIGLSRSMLHRKLIKLTGISASEHITNIRLNNAKSLLEHDASTVSETAYKVGFKSPSYFNKVFKKHFHISPGELKKEAILNSQIAVPNLKTNKNHKQKHKSKALKKKLSFILSIIILSSMGYYTFITSTSTGENSIAVLPLHNLTGDTANDYFVDGIHDALIGELGQISSLRVISRTSTLRYKEKDLLMKDIAKELGIETIVEGSIISSGDSIRILIQLIDVYPKERHILSNEYYDDISNVLKVQSTIVKEIAEEINIKLTKEEKQQIERTRSVNPETYKAYLRGMYYLNKGTMASFETGINYLQQAIDKDPGDPFAYAGLALGYSTLGHGQLNSRESFIRAKNAADKAIKLDPTIDEAHTALAILLLYQDWSWPETKKAFEQAIANTPNNATAHAHFAWYHILFNNKEDCLYHAKQAAIIEPLSASYNSWLAALYFHYQNYDQAEIWAKKALSLNENTVYGNYTLGLIQIKKRDYRKALEYIVKLPSQGVYWKTLRGYCHMKCNERDQALVYWNELEARSKETKVNPCFHGMMAAYLGYTDQAFKLLNEAIEDKSYPITYINFYTCTESIRNDPRYNALLLKMNLPALSK